MTNTKTDRGPLRSIEDIKRANEAAGFYFFTADTMRFFGSRTLSEVFPLVDGGAIFVTSEKSGFDDPTRRYTVRRALPSGDIAHYTDPAVEALDTYEEREAAKETTGTEFLQHPTARRALTVARKLAERINSEDSQ